MRQQTELMKSILTNKTAQKMIDYVSPVYGDSYVGLWLFQVFGLILSDLCAISDQLRYETNASTVDLLLDQWELQYGIPTDSSLSKEQRRDRLIAKRQSKGPCNPARLERMVSTAYNGVEVEIEENIAQNKFRVIIWEEVKSVTPAVQVIDKMKPAHLLYEIVVVIQLEPTDTKAAIAMTCEEEYTIQVGGEIYTVGEVLFSDVDGVTAEGETVVFSDGIAETDGEILNIM